VASSTAAKDDPLQKEYNALDNTTKKWVTLKQYKDLRNGDFSSTEAIVKDYLKRFAVAYESYALPSPNAKQKLANILLHPANFNLLIPFLSKDDLILRTKFLKAMFNAAAVSRPLSDGRLVISGASASNPFFNTVARFLFYQGLSLGRSSDTSSDLNALVNRAKYDLQFPKGLGPTTPAESSSPAVEPAPSGKSIFPKEGLLFSRPAAILPFQFNIFDVLKTRTVSFKRDPKGIIKGTERSFFFGEIGISEETYYFYDAGEDSYKKLENLQDIQGQIKRIAKDKLKEDFANN